MNKADLVAAMADSANTSKATAGKLLDAFTASVEKSLSKGESVTLVGFGTFSVSKRSARNGRNPRTGKAMKIPGRKVAKFKAGSRLASKVK